MKTLSERFAEKFIPEPNSGCWLWTGNVNAEGYGKIWTARPSTPLESAHRVSYKLHWGEIPEGVLVRHKCDVRACVNPSHLELGTIADNMIDRAERGRTAVGGKVRTTKLTPDQVREIRKSSLSTYELGRQYGVHNTTIFDIRHGKTWGHVQ